MEARKVYVVRKGIEPEPEPDPVQQPVWSNELQGTPGQLLDDIYYDVLQKLGVRFQVVFLLNNWGLYILDAGGRRDDAVPDVQV